jgi:hypothetical protein
MNCLIEKCGNKALCRGACEKHYRRVMGEIRAKWLTDTQAVAQGLLLPRKGFKTKKDLSPEPQEDPAIAAAMTLIERARKVDVVRAELNKLREALELIIKML